VFGVPRSVQGVKAKAKQQAKAKVFGVPRSVQGAQTKAKQQARAKCDK
jgi:hypothetical protein